jgi:phosphopantothenoylcysteine decarboxylase/phosphopantothenate--cysteine ligase
MNDFISLDSAPLAGRTILIGVSGSIAAYKSADLISELRKKGAEIHVVMTKSAT